MQDRAAPHRYIRRFTELTLLLALGCGDSSSPGSSSTEAIEKRIAMCDERERAISDWLSEYRSCETDSDCELSENNYGACVAEFLCGFALNVSVDREEFGREARKKISEHKDDCGCAIADCGRLMGAHCSPTTKLCEGTLAVP